MPKDKMNKETAATKIQSVFRGFFSRKKTNIYGESQGKEIEIYLPWGTKKKDSETCTYEMVGSYKYTVCESDLFNIQIDHMNFAGYQRLKIPEIVTAPYRKSNEKRSNLYSEEEIDSAVSDFISLLEEFTKKAASKDDKSYLRIDDLMNSYNQKHPRHPLKLSADLKKYLANPTYQNTYEDELEIIEEHKDIDLCFIYDKNCQPLFDKSSTPRTAAASEIVSENKYKSGMLVVHVQKTFSFPVEAYTPEILSAENNPDLHSTDQQAEILKEAHRRSNQFIVEHPVPLGANKEKILGLLTICVEHILSVTKSGEYKNLHEKADRPVLSIRHILHYVKKNICNEKELAWFDDMFKNHRTDIQKILCVDHYRPDFRGGGGGYGNPYSLSWHDRYDALFDLFGDFLNKSKMSKGDIGNPLTLEELKEMKEDGTISWENLFKNHLSLSGRTHLQLQKIKKEDGTVEYHPLFEARRIGLMTVDEFKSGKSRIEPPRDAKSDSPSSSSSNTMSRP